MKNTVECLMESEFGFNGTIVTESKKIFDGLESISENVRQLCGYTPEKVIMLTDGESYYCEFTNNLERLMSDQKLDLSEAVDELQSANNIYGETINIIVDESCIDKLNLGEIENIDYKSYRFIKK